MPDREECEFEMEKLLRDYEFAVKTYEAEMTRTLNIERIGKERYELLDEVIASLSEEREKVAKKLFDIAMECTR